MGPVSHAFPARFSSWLRSRQRRHRSRM